LIEIENIIATHMPSNMIDKTRG